MRKKRSEITYWRTKKGLEVDFILGDAKLAIEVKISEQVHKADLSGVIAFCQEHPSANAIVISQEKNKRLISTTENLSISIYPWKEFLSELWKEKLF